MEVFSQKLKQLQRERDPYTKACIEEVRVFLLLSACGAGHTSQLERATGVRCRPYQQTRAC